jgi:hypothetical protein
MKAWIAPYKALHRKETHSYMNIEHIFVKNCSPELGEILIHDDAAVDDCGVAVDDDGAAVDDVDDEPVYQGHGQISHIIRPYVTLGAPPVLRPRLLPRPACVSGGGGGGGWRNGEIKIRRPSQMSSLIVSAGAASCPLIKMKIKFSSYIIKF